MQQNKEFNFKTDRHNVIFREQPKMGIVREKRQDGSESVKLRGYAVVFNSESLAVGMTMDGREVREVIAPDAMDKLLASNPDVRALASHDSGVENVIGRTKSGTLKLSKDAQGLAVDIDLPDTSMGRDLPKQIDRGDIDGMSFGFYPTWETVETKDMGDYVLQIIHDIRELLEVSVVAWPAYPATSISVREMPVIKKPAYQPDEKALSLNKRRLEITKQKLHIWKI
jgi:uncharacterized protein